MFRAERMMRLNALVLARHERCVLQTLGHLGAVQLTRTPADSTTAPLNPPDRSRELAQCDRLLARIADLRGLIAITDSSDSDALAMTFADAERILASWEERAKKWGAQRDQLQRRLQELQTATEQVKPYRRLQLPLDQREPSPWLHYVTGSLPTTEQARVALAENIVLLPIPSREKGRQSVVALTTRSGQANLENVLRQAGFRRDPLPVVDGATTATAFNQYGREQAQMQAQLQQLNTDKEALAAAAAVPLTQIETWVKIERRLSEAGQFFPHTAATVLVTGWIAARDVPAVRVELEACTQGLCVIEVAEPKDVPEEEIPVLLRPCRWLRPFQGLVTAYGFPKYDECVPTLFVTISYVLMFGMMFGDVGHGGILALAGGGILLTCGGQRVRDLAMLLLVNGLSSVTFGAIYGSYFGLPQLKEYALWRDPLEGDPTALMRLAIGLGVLLMSLGLGLNISNRVRRGELMEGLLGKFGVTGVIFYWGTLLLVTKSAAIQAHGWLNWAMVLFLAAPMACWVLKEPLTLHRQPQGRQGVHSGGMVAACTESLVGAFEGVLLYVANTISFVRLAAYAMSHAALLMATFTLADQLRGLSGTGTVLSFGVIVLGNAVAMVLEGIVAAVQALRLEYYEFFGKFFSGDGQPFKPFSFLIERPN